MHHILAHIALCATAICVSACSSQEEKRIEKIEAEVAVLEADVSSCQNARDSASRHDGEQALAEWDEAAAEVVDDVSPDEERRIRAEMGKQMGLAPSEVNGWKEIYKARAAQAEKGEKARANLADRAWKYAEKACKTESESSTKLRKLEREKRRLKLASG